jgi:hypothetical protein
MKRIGMTLAVMLGGVLLGTGEARACEGHATGADAPPELVEPAKEAASAEEARAAEESGPLLTAKCQCGSAADCTCKKGTCKCPKCKKPGRDVVEPLQGQRRTEEPRKVRYGASAGTFIQAGGQRFPCQKERSQRPRNGRGQL